MAYDSNDDRSNNPKAVLRRAGFTIVNKSIPEGICGINRPRKSAARSPERRRFGLGR